MKISAAALVIVLSVARLAAGDVRVTPLVREGRVWVDIELRRGVPFWPDRVHHSLIFWPWDRGLVSTNVNFTFIP